MLTLSPKSDHRVMMKQIKTLLAVSLATGLLALSAAETDGFYLWKNGKTVGFYPFSIVCENDAISLGESIFNVNDIDSITFINPDEMGGISADTVFVNFDGQTAVQSRYSSVVGQPFNSVFSCHNSILLSDNQGRSKAYITLPPMQVRIIPEERLLPKPTIIFQRQRARQCS